MVVVVANDLPPAVRGRMKLWFVEARANVFVSGIKDSVAEDVIGYLTAHCPANSGAIIFHSLPRPPGYAIYTIGTPSKRLTRLLGLQLVIEALQK
jgi:CRISPR-associated protein Cas2